MAITAKGSLMIEVGAGELIDKITILKIKADRMTDVAKLTNVKHELDILSRACENLNQPDELDWLEDALRRLNEALWVIEDDIHACEVARNFGPKFVERDFRRLTGGKYPRRAVCRQGVRQAC